MRILAPDIELTATDLSWFLGCRHRTALDLAVAHGRREAPTWVDPMMRVLQQRGLDHERRYADALRAQGLVVADIAEQRGEDAVARTLDAMRSGAGAILQPALRSGRWFGRPDVFLRVEIPSALGDWSYQVVDTKLAKETRGGTVLQLALYSDLLAAAQGTAPDRFQVVTPDPEAPVQTFRVRDYAAYFRFVRSRLELTAEEDPDAVAAANYPEPVPHCDVCRWWSACEKKRRADDHLCLVAGISKLQTRELSAAGTTTLAKLGTLPLPLTFAPRRGSPQTYVRVREQARVQLEGRTRGIPVHEMLLPIVPDQGLARLPEPSPGDIFLDIEGDPFVGSGGREYLFGLVSDSGVRALWAYSDAEERAAFESSVDEILAAWTAHPGMHVYHYAPYEPATFKRLMGRHATREAEVDRMLRAGVFVDLYAVVRQSLRASVESYSIKNLEPFYGFTRAVPLKDAGTNQRVIQRALELSAPEAITQDVRAAVEGYNQDDCLSARRLRDWLETLRAAIEAGGTEVPRPAPKDGAAPEKVDARAARSAALASKLLADVPPERAKRSPEQQGRWLLAHLLDFHLREWKAPWWEYFRLRDLPEEDLLEEKSALSGLRFEARVGGTKKCPIDRYTYPPQEADVRAGDDLHLPDGSSFGDVEAIDRIARWVDVKKAGAHAEEHPSAVFAHNAVNPYVLSDALARIAEDVVQDGLSGGTSYRAARDLLLGRPPRLRTGAFMPRDGEGVVPFAVRVGSELDDTVLPIQGPPGAGKTFTGARMIVDLAQRGVRVGVTAMSHKVIRKLLDDVMEASRASQPPIRCAHKVGDASEAASAVLEVTKNEEALALLREGRAHVLGGTAWLWARPEFRAAVDVLFVDEAGQMSLASALAASHAARSVVLLGDPQQLEQPKQASHPEGTDVSALQHILGEHQTMPPDRGIFLPETWRLAPSICDFTSEVFYEGKLRSRAGLDRQALSGAGAFDGAGLWVVKVPHEGNRSSSSEEADEVERIVSGLLREGTLWTGPDGMERAMTPADILVVAPYNSHVALLGERLAARGVRVGTVDRFQGQEGPVVVYSLATSSPEDAPRGMEFLYSLNRLNVATSRARCACILVASPRLFTPECQSPRQMRLANAICRYVEVARTVESYA